MTFSEILLLIFSIFIVLIILLRVIVFLIGRYINRISSPPMGSIRPEIRAFHDQLFVADLHSDPLLWNRDLLARNNYGHIDLPRLQEGNVALEVIGVATKAPWGLNFESNPANSDLITPLVIFQGWPFRTWGSLLRRALYHSERLHRIILESRGKIMLVESAEDLKQLIEKRNAGQKMIGTLLSLEGAHALEGDLNNLDILCQAGFRMVGLTHFFDNQVGGSAHGLEGGGLTNFGRDLVRSAQEKRMLIDLAHASPQMIRDVCALTRVPVISSHVGVGGVYKSPRNLMDDLILCIAETGGLIGIPLFKEAVGGTSLEDTARSMVYAVDLVGADHVGLGTDFDGAISAPIDVSGLPMLTQALIDQGLSPEDVSKVMGENALRVLLETLP